MGRLGRVALVGAITSRSGRPTLLTVGIRRWGAEAVRLAPALWALALAVLMLGGALGPGYTLSFDMVWVPDLTLGRDVLGLGSALPRAIPSDAVVAILDEVFGGALLQKLVLLMMLTGAGAGFAALVRERSTGAQVVAVTVGIWNPYVVERLLLGHWPLLIGYAVLPWMIVALRAGGRERLPVRVLPLLVLGSLSASAGVMTALVALTVSWTGRRRQTLQVLVCIVAANAPWLVAGLSSPAANTTDPAGALVFKTGDEGLMSGPLAALSFGGVWNSEVVPTSRLGVAGVAMTALLVGAAVLGLVRAARGAHVEDLGPLAWCWCFGWVAAAVSWASPESLGWLGQHVPAGGLFRDGSRLLGLTVPFVVVLVALAVDGLLTLLPVGTPRVVAATVLALVPVSLMPDAMWGRGGQLNAAHYPSAYDEVRRAVSEAPPGDALSLPFESYRVPEWNGFHRVLDPLGRYLDRPTVVSDALVVSGRQVTGEDPRSAEVVRALRLDGPAERSRALRKAGISVVVAEEIDGYPVPELDGRTTVQGELSVIELGPAKARTTSLFRVTAMALAWLVWLTVLLSPLARARRVLHRGRWQEERHT